MTGLDAIKAATWDLHMQAERSGIIADILAGRASRDGIALLLRNLLPVYQALDHSAVGDPALARSGAIEADLRLLAPHRDLPLLPEGAAYAERVRQAQQGLIAHAYVRYLGDLNGGRIMQKRFAACLGEAAEGISFYNYPAVDDMQTFLPIYRAALDHAVRSGDVALIKAEAMIAFEMNIALAQAVKQHVETI